MSHSRSLSDPHPQPAHVSLGGAAHILGGDPRKPWLEARSRRSLEAAGFTLTPIESGPGLLLRAGHVLRAPETFKAPPLLEGRPLVAIGLPPSGAWADFHRRHGGDYPGELPVPLCEWHSSPATLQARLRGEPLPSSTRVVHWPVLDLAETDERLAVYQIVTSLQHGGAEKIARDLAEELPRHGVATRLVVLGKPHRKPLDAPPGTLDLSHLRRGERAGILVKHAIAQGADVLHVHLTDADETRVLSKSGIPVIATVHNSRQGWPRNWETLRSNDVSLLLACSQAVETELREALPELPVRTVWNGIRPHEFPETPLPSTATGFTLACVANPRPQKRLELLPAIVAATRHELMSRGVNQLVKLVIAGETSDSLADALVSRKLVDREAEKHGIDLTWTEGEVPVRDVLARAHALVSCSAHEGLSLAHLEAMSSGRPVIACDTGGTRELAWRNPAVRLLDAAAPPEQFAREIVNALLAPLPSAHKGVWRDFTTERMAGRVARFARQAACLARKGTTLWFVTNNLSMGGAQSSLRRLAKSFHAKGHRVRVALLQEYPEHPTAGRTDLLEHGIEVFVPPPSGIIGPQESVDLILAEMTADPPAAVVFWNAITLHKLLLADALPFTPVHDISPGEMWFSSFERTMENPPPGLPCRVPRHYGRLLESFVVKYGAEAERAKAIGAPVAVIPNGVLLPDQPRRRSHFKGKLVFGTAARISPQKRLDELIEAFRIALPELPDCVLRIAGGVETGAEECAESLRELAMDLPVEWRRETQDIGGFHAGCDVFVMISDPAGCPNASLEALASGLPVIASDVGGASEQVIDGVNGRLVPARDVRAFANAMVDLAHDATKRDAMSVAAREHIRRHFTLERMTNDYLRLFLPDAI
ncbi:glycosyltransferase family 4 protein [Luteolibacter arcticus]|uniref:Glycosyltransferase family 4 protein n=1 Tax=Luteolibacter arcticus TaxID=1581411 RepID=A0ABT3GKC8_9BACT|nr:glycosyltransferase family 4 protein [Luteolibacter arcticus]MCW1923979.1 glycosyltransferase family 4 protein [Luteolibacter arcticus]